MEDEERGGCPLTVRGQAGHPWLRALATRVCFSRPAMRPPQLGTESTTRGLLPPGPDLDADPGLDHSS